MRNSWSRSGRQTSSRSSKTSCSATKRSSESSHSMRSAVARPTIHTQRQAILPVKTICLTEYETVSTDLTTPELDQLLASGLVSIAPRLDRQYDVTASSTVGTAMLPSIRLLVRPKIGVHNLFFLLGHALNLPRWED